LKQPNICPRGKTVSVTIVSSLPKQTAPQAPENAKSTDSEIAAPDFSDLLQGQLAGMAPPVLPEALPETIPAAETLLVDTLPSDTAALLASLGLVPQEARRSDEPLKTTDAATGLGEIGDSAPSAGSSLATVGKTDKTLADALTSRQTALSAAAGDKAENPAASGAAVANPSETLAAKDMAAKLAAPAAAVVATAKNSPPDALANNLAALASNSLVQSNAAPANRDASLSVTTPIRDQNWAVDFGQKIVWLASNDKQSAQLTLNPPQMGPIEISLNVEKGLATASFVSANAEVRDALETALPRLREMFASAGIELGQTNVGAESFKQHAESTDDRRGGAQGRSDNAILDAGSAAALPARRFTSQLGNGMVDIFA
jgi:flagellar hook-length control protein FliK